MGWHLENENVATLPAAFVYVLTLESPGLCNVAFLTQMSKNLYSRSSSSLKEGFKGQHKEGNKNWLSLAASVMCCKERLKRESERKRGDEGMPEGQEHLSHVNGWP